MGEWEKLNSSIEETAMKMGVSVPTKPVSILEEHLTNLNEAILRLDHQLLQLGDKISPILAAPYPVAPRDEGSMDKRNQSHVSDMIENHTQKIQELAFVVGQLIDRVDV